MSPEIAQQVVAGITLLGGLVWLLSLNVLVKSARLAQAPREERYDELPVRNMVTGRAEVEGDPRSLATRAAAVLARGALGPLKIVEKTGERIAFERLDPGIANQPAGRWFRRGELRFSSARSNRTQVEWTVEPGNFEWLLRAGGAVQALGLAALILGCWAMLEFVASSPTAAVRWQSLQMLQVVHVLWPPFLFAGLYRKGIRSVAAEFEALASNLPYLGSPEFTPPAPP